MVCIICKGKHRDNNQQRRGCVEFFKNILNCKMIPPKIKHGRVRFNHITLSVRWLLRVHSCDFRLPFPQNSRSTTFLWEIFPVRKSQSSSFAKNVNGNHMIAPFILPKTATQVFYCNLYEIRHKRMVFVGNLSKTVEQNNYHFQIVLLNTNFIFCFKHNTFRADFRKAGQACGLNKKRHI